MAAKRRKPKKKKVVKIDTVEKFTKFFGEPQTPEEQARLQRAHDDFFGGLGIVRVDPEA